MDPQQPTSPTTSEVSTPTVPEQPPVQPLAEPVQTPPPTAPPVENKLPKSKNSLFIIAAILLIVAALGAVGVLAYQRFTIKPTTIASPSPTATADPTVNWKTHTDNTLSIEFKYPEYLTSKDLGNGVVGFVDSQNKTRFNLSGIQILSVTEYQDYLQKRKNSGNSFEQKTTMDSLKRDWLTDITLGEVYNYTAVLNQSSKYYVLSLQSNFDDLTDNGKSFINLADQILSTFKLSTDSSIVDTSNWKTYLNQGLGFSFKYPSEYILEERGNKDYINLVTNSEDPYKDQVGIDAQSITNNISYKTLQASEEAKLTNIKRETDGNWVKITGDGTGYSEGEKFTIAISNLQGKVIRITTTSTNTVILKTLDQILSTFKFSTANSTVDTSNWKTYTNTQFGFSLKYPATWINVTGVMTVENGNREFRLQTNHNEFVSGVVFDKTADMAGDTEWGKNIELSNGKSLLITYTEILGLDQKVVLLI